MKTISYKLKDLDQKEKKVTLKLGYVGENEHVQIRINCAEIWKDYPAAVASLAVEPPEGEKYPAIVTRDGDMVCWTVKDSDLVNDGYGRIQLTFTEGSEIQKTVICRTKVDESIVGSGTAPDPIADFVSEANEALAELEAAEVHGPVIGEDGYWYTWSKDAGEYVKTDTKAQGEDGQQGPAGKDGADGAPGQDGHTPVKGTDYWTQQDQADIVAAAALETVSAVIDDTAGDGDTNKTWSADKIAETTGQLLNAIDGIKDDLILDVNAIALWEKGSIALSDGVNAANTSRIRTKGYLPKTVKKISISSGYRYVICAYSDGVYQGQWTGSGFSKTMLQIRTADTIVKDVGNYDLRIFFESTTSGTNIDTSVYNNIIFTGIFDETFSVEGAYAEAKKVGETVQGIENKIDNIAIAGRLFSGSVCWKYGSLNSSGSYTSNKGRVQTLPITIEQGEQITVECITNTVVFGVYTYNRSDGSFNAISKIIDAKAFIGTDETLKYVILARTNPDTSTIANKEDVTNNIRITVKSKIANIINMIEKYIQYKSILTGKRWAVCGDSFSRGDFTGYPIPENGKIKDGLYKDSNAVYAYFIGNRTGMSIDMVASNGQTLASVESYGNCFVEKLVSAGNYGLISSDTDYITLWFGINDKIQSVPVGDTDSSDVSTFCGAWNTVLTYLRNYHPFAHVGIVVSNSSGSEALPYAEATKAMAKKYGYPYLDLMYDDTLPLLLFEGGRSDVSSSIRSLVHEQMAVNPPSNMHPNEKAHELESYFIEDWLKRI